MKHFIKFILGSILFSLVAFNYLSIKNFLDNIHVFGHHISYYPVGEIVMWGVFIYLTVYVCLFKWIIIGFYEFWYEFSAHMKHALSPKITWGNYTRVSRVKEESQYCYRPSSSRRNIGSNDSSTGYSNIDSFLKYRNAKLNGSPERKLNEYLKTAKLDGMIEASKNSKEIREALKYMDARLNGSDESRYQKVIDYFKK